MKKYKGRILEVYKATGGFKRIISGIKESQQPFYDRTFYGSNGTYLASNDTFPVIYAKVIIYDLGNEIVEIDIREKLIEHYEWQRVSENRVLAVKNKLRRKKITLIEKSTDEYEIDNLTSLL
jgi:hypothetical protein